MVIFHCFLYVYQRVGLQHTNNCVYLVGFGINKGTTDFWVLNTPAYELFEKTPCSLGTMELADTSTVIPRYAPTPWNNATFPTCEDMNHQVMCILAKKVWKNEIISTNRWTELGSGCG